MEGHSGDAVVTCRQSANRESGAPGPPDRFSACPHGAEPLGPGGDFPESRALEILTLGILGLRTGGAPLAACCLANGVVKA